MTYRKLAEIIANMDEKKKDMDVTIHVKDDDLKIPQVNEYYPCDSFGYSINNDELEDGHPILSIEI